MKFLAVACLLGVALSVKVAETDPDLEGTQEAPLEEFALDTEDDPVEDQIDNKEKLKAFERAQVPDDYMYFKSPIY